MGLKRTRATSKLVELEKGDLAFSRRWKKCGSSLNSRIFHWASGVHWRGPKKLASQGRRKSQACIVREKIIEIPLFAVQFFGVFQKEENYHKDHDESQERKVENPRQDELPSQELAPFGARKASLEATVGIEHVVEEHFAQTPLESFSKLESTANYY